MQVGRGVVYDEYTFVPEIGFQTQDLFGFFGFTQPDLKNEVRPFVDFADDANVAAHHFDQLLGNGQAQTGTAILARDLPIGLRESREDVGLLLGRNANAGIKYIKLQAKRVVAGLWLVAGDDTQAHFAALRKFDRVAQQVKKDLPQSSGIAAHESRDFFTQVVGEFQLFQCNAWRKGFEGVADQVKKIKVGFLQIQLASLNLGEIKNVVNDREQVLGGGFHQIEIFALFAGELGFQSKVHHADHPIHGGANFMAHVGQKFAFHAICRLGGLSRLNHFFMLRLNVGIEAGQFLLLRFSLPQCTRQFGCPRLDHGIQFRGQMTQAGIALIELEGLFLKDLLGLLAGSPFSLKANLPGGRLAHLQPCFSRVKRACAPGMPSTESRVTLTFSP